MLVVDKVTKCFGENFVLRGVSFSIDSGDVVGLVGPSGSGKSVLLKILGGVLPVTSGIVQSESKDSAVGFLFQEGALFDSMSVLENVAFALTHLPNEQRASYQERSQRAYDMLEEVGLAKACRKLPGQLSGGMRRRVALARALVARPKLVFLDDPTGGLDPVAASVIMDLIAELHGKYRPTVIIVSHDIRRLLPRVKRVLSLFDGVILSDTPPQRIVEDAPERVTKFLATRFDFSDTQAFAV